MNDLVAGIGIIIIGILLTIGGIVFVQKFFWQRASGTAPQAGELVSADEFVLEKLSSLTSLPTPAQLEAINRDLLKRYHLPPAQAEEKLTTVLRSPAFERIYGARCTCYASSRHFGKYFHSPDCEYRQFLEEKE